MEVGKLRKAPALITTFSRLWPSLFYSGFVYARKSWSERVAKIDVLWADTDTFSVFDVGRDLGFDLRKFDEQPDEVKAFIKKATVDQVIRNTREAWRAAFERGGPSPEQDFNKVKRGVYVICIGGGFGIKYKGGCSEVLYIGRGVIANRLRSHLNNWIFDMSRSLRDMPFRFYMEQVGDGRSSSAYKDFEHYLLQHFSDKFDEKPLINKISGRQASIDHEFNGNWRAPFDSRGKRRLWEIHPAKANPWFKEYVDE